jgi:uncharacterized protein
MFIDRVFQLAQKKSNDAFGQLFIEDVRIGVFLVAVKMSNGFYGTASVIHSNEVHQVTKKQRDFGDFTPMHIIGKTVGELFAFPKNTAIVQMLRIATLNAYFHQLLHQNAYSFSNQTDPIDTLDFQQFPKIVMVGAFNSYIHKIAATASQLQVLELNEEAFLPEHQKFFVPADRYKEVIPQADLVIMTGLTLVNNTFDDLLQSIKPSSKSVLIGPSASIPPELFFEHHISMIGGTMITKPEFLFSMVGQGAAGYHLFEYCAEKITIFNPNPMD